MLEIVLALSLLNLLASFVAIWQRHQTIRSLTNTGRNFDSRIYAAPIDTPPQT